MVFSKIRVLLPVLAAALLAGCVPPPQGPGQLLPVTTTPPVPGRLDSVGVGERGLVSAADPRAADAGAQMLRLGGSATDAAIATMLALTVVEPQSSGIGGGGFFLLGNPDGSIETIDGRETAPMAAGGQWFYKDGQPLTVRQAVPGGRSVGVPGNLRLAAEAHGAHGKLAWRTLFRPAIRLARDGFVITPRLNRALAQWPAAALDPASRALFFGADGKPLPVGTLIRNPALADTLERIAARGADSFYVGPDAQAIAAKVGTSPVNPAPMTTGDIAAYEAKERPPLCGTYRGYRICGMGPPSSGQTSVYAVLKQLERFDLAALGPDSPVSWHLIAESQRLAYADRARYLGDPDYVDVPLAGLMDETYLAARGALISVERTMPSVAAGNPAGAPAFADAQPAEENGTSHFAVVDRLGSSVSYTSTVEAGFGSGLMVGGYYLNNELTDFDFVPEIDGRPVANRVEGGKRPRSSMAPTLVYAPDGQLVLVIGAAGGSTIPMQVAKALIGVIDWKLSAQTAIALPVIFASGDTIYVEPGSALEGMIPALVGLGHKVEARAANYKANAIQRSGNRWQGAADPRSEGAAIAE
jgi:gamma-glutamyltranspeptidase/glutathione hydrolase